MVTNLPLPLPTNADAWQRAVRTLAIGLLVDAGIALAGLLVAQLPGVQWTREWWLGLGALAASTVVKAVASYIGRKVSPPSL